MTPALLGIAKLLLRLAVLRVRPLSAARKCARQLSPSKVYEGVGLLDSWTVSCWLYVGLDCQFHLCWVRIFQTAHDFIMSST